MNLRTRLSDRIQIQDIHEIVLFSKDDENRKQELYKLLFDTEDIIAYQAAWVFCHFNKKEIQWLETKQNELIDEVLICKHAGKRRLLLNLIFRQSLIDLERIDFLDFCMNHMLSKDEFPGIKTLCMKIVYEICCSIPELLPEFRLMLDIMEPDLLPTSIRTVRKNILKNIDSKIQDNPE